MNSTTTSFFIKQKQFKYSVAKTNKSEFVLFNSTATYIFDQYLFTEKALYNTSLSVYESQDPQVYATFLHLSSLSTVYSGHSIMPSVKLDIFAFYITLQLAFKVNYSLITGRPNDLAFFCYYNKAFRNNFYISSSFDVSKQTICATKHSRFDYQRKFESRKQGTFIRNGSQNGVSLFNRIFCKNNSYFIATKKKVQNFFSKKLRSTKAIRGAVLEDKYSKRFQSQEQKLSFIKFYKKAQIRRKSVVDVFKSIAIFPQSIWFRNQVLKVITRQKKGKKRVNTSLSNLVYVKKNGSYTKALIPTALHFKLFPTEYEESTLNPNNFAQFKALVSFITLSRFSFYQVNALSLTRYRFDSKIKALSHTSGSKIKLSYFYLTSMERQRVSRYRYIGVYLKDLIRVCFLSRYRKKADFLATFFAFTISKLPRNRKELKFVHFLIKLLKRSAWQNKDILGVRIRFQGRLNRWRRTKHIVGSKGNIAFSSYHNRIEYGMAQAITRKGTLGVHIWIAYQPGSFSVLAKSIISYVGLTPLVVSVK